MINLPFEDSVQAIGTRINNDGFLIGEAYAARAGIQTYLASDFGIKDKQFVKIYRSPEEVTNPDSVKSYSHAPITIGHPKTPVTAENWKDLAVGEVSTEIEWKDGKIRVPLIVKDSPSINRIKTTHGEISMGYKCDVELTPGVTPEGEEYDGTQHNIRINHLAFVPAGRAGIKKPFQDSVDDPDCWGIAPKTTIDEKEISMSMKPVVVGDQVANVAIEDAQKVEGYLRDMQATHQTAVTKLTADHDRELGAKDAEIETLKAQITELQGKVLSDAEISQRAEARAQLLQVADALAPGLELKTLSDADVRRAVLTKRLGDAKVKDKSDDYVLGVFDSLAANAKPAQIGDSVIAPQHRPLGGNRHADVPTNDSTFGQIDFVHNLNDAWKTPFQTAKEA